MTSNTKHSSAQISWNTPSYGHRHNTSSLTACSCQIWSCQSCHKECVSHSGLFDVWTLNCNGVSESSWVTGVNGGNDECKDVNCFFGPAWLIVIIRAEDMQRWAHHGYHLSCRNNLSPRKLAGSESNDLFVFWFVHYYFFPKDDCSWKESKNQIIQCKFFPE